MASTSSFGRMQSGSHTCTDPVVGAILSGWRYDIPGVPADLRSDYEAHLATCSCCRSRQRKHRTIDILLLAVTTLMCAAFALAALIIRREQVLASHYALHVKLHPAEAAGALTLIPSNLTIGLEAVAVAGILLSLLLWAAIAMVTPVTGIVIAALRERVSPELRERLWKHAA